MSGKVLGTVVLVPGHRVISSRAGQDVHVPVVIHVDGKNGSNIDEIGRDGMRSKALQTVVLVPGKLVIIHRGRQDIDVPITIHVGRIHLFCVNRTRRNDVWFETGFGLKLEFVAVKNPLLCQGE